MPDRSHGSPYDRGRADAYYGRARHPHKYPNGTHNPPRIELTDPAEIAEYNLGYASEDDRKDWGDPDDLMGYMHTISQYYQDIRS